MTLGRYSEQTKIIYVIKSSIIIALFYQCIPKYLSDIYTMHPADYWFYSLLQSIITPTNQTRIESRAQSTSPCPKSPGSTSQSRRHKSPFRSSTCSQSRPRSWWHTDLCESALPSLHLLLGISFQIRAILSLAGVLVSWELKYIAGGLERRQSCSCFLSLLPLQLNGLVGAPRELS